MKIPYIINKNTVVVYTPSKNSLQLVGENIRKLVAENFEWDKDHCPSLKEYCVNAIGKNFENKPILDELPCSDRVHLLDILPIKLPLELMIPLIDDEYYWKRRYHETYGLIKRHLPENWTYKSVYIERHVQQLIEEAQPQYNDEETFDEILDLCSPYVTCLYIEQMQAWKPPLTMEKEDIPEEYPIDHINFWPILRRLPEVEEFHLIYGMNKVGEDFSWRMFKVSVSDCQKLGKALLELKNLKIVRIHRSSLEFKHCQALMQGLIKHKFIEELDLSNCDVGDAGALCIAQYLMDGCSLKTLILANNQIGQIGSEGLGFAILNDNCDTLYVGSEFKNEPAGYTRSDGHNESFGTMFEN
ncbi:dynein regulatory complex subunit 5-like isoform X2 [Sitophilus oryzae]|uniref:Dynein regulatory complex subunit 5-like isoform X2 n=1 Tax=Sitophilus oryzae TaxID=7048 RepID=A0A6J2YFQ5_SITOR|nr:dynein regulatory complex subunit 5-like isoform X2 [Sitophilus oryzae]